MARALLTLYLVAILLFIDDCNTFNSNELLAGDSLSAKCIPGKRQNNSEDYLTTTEFIRRNGYEAEEHTVVTADGYILTLHRIPSSKPNATAVFAQHGLLCSSFDWLVAGKENAIGFLLAERGYDVWLGNARGNTYSRCHTRYTTSDYEFWDFSFHEIGVYDLPAMITYVANVTNQKLFYIGHSMGTTTFFVMASERPDVASNVRAMFSLSTIAYMGRVKSVVRIFKTIDRKLERYPEIFGTYECLPQSPVIKNFLKFACTLTKIQQKFCYKSMFAVVGTSPFQSNSSLLPTILTNLPAGISFKIALHYLQEVKSGKFQYYNYGDAENLRRYNSEEPPSYNVSRIQVPVAIFWAPNDYLSHPVDVLQFYKQLPNPLFRYKVRAPFWNHVDYLWGIDVRRALHMKLLSAIKDLSKDLS